MPSYSDIRVVVSVAAVTVGVVSHNPRVSCLPTTQPAILDAHNPIHMAPFTCRYRRASIAQSPGTSVAYLTIRCLLHDHVEGPVKERCHCNPVLRHVAVAY